MSPAPACGRRNTFLGTDNGVFADVDGSVVGYAKVPTPGWLIVVDRPATSSSHHCGGGSNDPSSRSASCS